MKPSIAQTLYRYRYALCALVAVVAMYGVATLVVAERLEDFTALLKLQISEQELILASIASATARNGADAVTESIIKDCNVNERDEFDVLLGQLNRGLSFSELTKLERLFDRCGSFYSERKSTMVARLNREIEVYESLVVQLQQITQNSEQEEDNLTLWKQLAAEERRQSELFSTLVSLQGEIITTLLAGKSVTSEEITNILSQVDEAQGTLLGANLQAKSIREQLLPL